MDYNHSNHYKYSCKYHIIFCPKYRKKVLVNGVDEDLKKIILDLQKDMYKVIEMEIMPDYVHLFLDCSPYKSPVDIVKHIKHQSALILKKKYPVELGQKNAVLLDTQCIYLICRNDFYGNSSSLYSKSEKEQPKRKIKEEI